MYELSELHQRVLGAIEDARKNGFEGTAQAFEAIAASISVSIAPQHLGASMFEEKTTPPCSLH